jgi:hypothetical protein
VNRRCGSPYTSADAAYLAGRKLPPPVQQQLRTSLFPDDRPRTIRRRWIVARLGHRTGCLPRCLGTIGSLGRSNVRIACGALACRRMSRLEVPISWLVVDVRLAASCLSHGLHGSPNGQRASPYVSVGDSLAEVHQPLPVGLVQLIGGHQEFLQSGSCPVITPRPTTNRDR